MVLVGSHATASHRAPRQLARGDLAFLSRSARCTASKREEPPCSYHSGSTQLPGDVWWLDSKCQEYRAVLYGTTFVLCRGFQQRPELGLTLTDSRAQGIQGFSAARPVEVVYHSDQEYGYQGLTARGSGYVTSRFVGEAGNCSLLDKPKERRALPAAPGYLVPLSSVEDTKFEEEGREDETDIFETSSDSPRRTSKVRFTCNVCGAVNIKSVNPRAMRHGTVFAECGQCCIKHKLVDNLKLFHELTGAVFPAQPSALNTSKLSAAARRLLRERGWEL